MHEYPCFVHELWFYVNWIWDRSCDTGCHQRAIGFASQVCRSACLFNGICSSAPLLFIMVLYLLAWLLFEGNMTTLYVHVLLVEHFQRNDNLHVSL